MKGVVGALLYTPDAGFSGTDSFTYTVTDNQGGRRSATVSVTVGEDDVIAETGTVQLTHEARTIALGREYENPVALAWVATERGGDPVVVQLGEVSGDELTLRLREPDYEDGDHKAETVNWMVVEAGTWRLPDGTLLEAGTLRSDKLSSAGFEEVSFAAEFDARPVVLSQVQTEAGADFVVTRQRGANSEGFEVTMQEEEAHNDGSHKVETLGWVAIEAGAGSAEGFDWVAGRARDVGDGGAVLDLSAELGADALVLVGLSSFHGADTAGARGEGGSGGRVRLGIEEERSADNETLHEEEHVDYFGFARTGMIQGYDEGLFV